MSLATVSGDKPWVCEVHFVYDDNLNLYWRSLSSRRHSQEIAANPNVAGNIVRQHSLEEYPHAIYFDGKAVDSYLKVTYRTASGQSELLLAGKSSDTVNKAIVKRTGRG